MPERIYSYPPIVDENCAALILGTMPSVKSLEDGFYYAHPRNAFWPILADIFGEEKPVTIEEKKSLLLRHHIALWDTAASCVREGSLDSAMRDVALNDIAGLLSRYPRLEKIFVNGGEAERLLRRALPHPPIPVVRLPSTSPAYTMSYEKKLAAWREALFR